MSKPSYISPFTAEDALPAIYNQLGTLRGRRDLLSNLLTTHMVAENHEGCAKVRRILTVLNEEIAAKTQAAQDVKHTLHVLIENGLNYDEIAETMLLQGLYNEIMQPYGVTADMEIMANMEVKA